MPGLRRSRRSDSVYPRSRKFFPIPLVVAKHNKSRQFSSPKSKSSSFLCGAIDNQDHSRLLSLSMSLFPPKTVFRLTFSTHLPALPITPSAKSSSVDSYLPACAIDILTADSNSFIFIINQQAPTCVQYTFMKNVVVILTYVKE